MKLLLQLTLITLFISLTASQVGRIIMHRAYSVTEGLAYGKFFRISFNSVLIFLDAPEATKLEYIATYIWPLAEVRFYEDNDITKDRTDDFDITIIKNEVLARKTGNVFMKVRPKLSIEPFTGSVVFYATPFRFTPLYNVPPKEKHREVTVLTLPLIPNKNAHPLEMRGQWVPETDWTSISHTFFGFVKIIFNLTMIGAVFYKPFLSEYAKIHASWVGQTVIWWQYFMYTGLSTGLFGGVINDIQDGFLQASREYFFMKAIPKFSKQFLTETFGFSLYKYFDNELIPALTEETFIEITLLASLALFSLCIENFTTKQKLIKVVRELKSSVSLFSVTPISIYGLYICYSYPVLNNFYSFLAILNIILVTFSWFYFLTYAFSKMSLTVNAINYIHSKGAYQEGKVECEQCSDWAFDSYISMNTSIKLRILEFLLLFGIASSYVLTYQWKTASTLFILFIWIVMTLLQIEKLKKFESGTPERDLTYQILKINLVFTSLMTVQYIIFSCLYILKSLSLAAVKIFTMIYIVVAVLTTLVLLLQLGMRIRSIFIVPEHVKDEREYQKRKNRNSETYQSIIGRHGDQENQPVNDGKMKNEADEKLENKKSEKKSVPPSRR